jgi:hypothetical protein
MTTAMDIIGEKRRRWHPTISGKDLFPVWDRFQIVPIWSDAVAPHLCHQGRVPMFMWHAAFQQTTPSC